MPFFNLLLIFFSAFNAYKLRTNDVTTTIPKTIAPAINATSVPSSIAFIYEPCIILSIVLYIPSPGTNGIIPGIIYKIAGLLSFLAKNSLIKVTKNEATKFEKAEL